MMVAHFCGCGFFCINELENSSDSKITTWIDKVISTNEDSTYFWFDVYINSLYWAVITMITLGYGDIVPQTIHEKIYVIIAAMIGCGIFAYSVNTIGIIINELNKKKNELRN